jgi:hypothetical protein
VPAAVIALLMDHDRFVVGDYRGHCFPSCSLRHTRYCRLRGSRALPLCGRKFSAARPRPPPPDHPP